MDELLVVNGIDLETLGFVARTRRLPRVGGQRTATAEVPQSIGAIVTGAAGGPGRLIVEGTLAAAGRAELLQRIDEIAAALQGECVIRFGDFADREWHGILQAVQHPVSELDPQWTNRAALLTLEWLLPDPTAVAITETILGGTDVALDLGTAPSPIAVDVQASDGGPITQIVVTVFAGATPLRTLTWTGEFSPPSLWRVDDESHAITVDGAHAIDGLSADSEFPEAHPLERADRVTVAVTGGEAQVMVRYHKRWW